MRPISRLLCVIGLIAGTLAIATPAQAVCVVDGLEEDDTVAQANPLDKSATLNAYSCIGDPDVFRVLVEGGASFDVTVTPEASFNVALDLLNANGTVASTVDEGNDGEAETIGLFAVIPHYSLFRVRGAGGSDEGSYSIEVTGTGIPTAAPISALESATVDNLDWLDAESASSTVVPGWAFKESGGAANGLYVPSNGTGAGGDTYSYGQTLATDRAFGMIREGTSTFFSTITQLYRNDTGSIIDSVDISYTGELWHLGEQDAVDALDFSYAADESNFATFTNENALDFTTPTNALSPGAVDGNQAANRSAVSTTIAGLDIAPGDHFYLRWNDRDITNTEDGLAVDDLSVTVHLPPPDADDDGVPDANDQCADTPTGESVDANGCSESQKDDDTDGVTNDLDLCASTPSGVEVGPDGCAWDLTVTRKGKGKVTSIPEEPPLILCGTDCTETYPSGELVSLKAKPKRGNRFVRWDTGPCAGSKTNPCEFSMDFETAVHAKFKPR